MITFYVQKRNLSCHWVWQMTHCLFRYNWSASGGESALLSYTVVCLLGITGSMNLQSRSRVNYFILCIFYHHLQQLCSTELGFHQKTPQHPKFLKIKDNNKTNQPTNQPTRNQNKATKQPHQKTQQKKPQANNKKTLPLKKTNKILHTKKTQTNKHKHPRRKISLAIHIIIPKTY